MKTLKKIRTKIADFLFKKLILSLPEETRKRIILNVVIKNKNIV